MRILQEDCTSEVCRGVHNRGVYQECTTGVYIRSA